jgi:hypothetical protein
MMVRRVRRRKTRVRLDLLPSASNPRRNVTTVAVGGTSQSSAKGRQPKEATLVVAVVVALLAKGETKAAVAEAAEGEVRTLMPIWHAIIATKKVTLKETALNSRISRMVAPIRIMVLLHS